MGKNSALFFRTTSQWKFSVISIGKAVNFQNGQFFTLLPPSANFSNLYNFKSGGIILPSQKTTENGRTVWKPIQSVTKDLCQFIYSYIQKSISGYVIGEDIFTSKDDREILIPNTERMYFSNELYYLAQKKAEIENINSIIRFCDVIYHLLIVIGEGKLPQTENLSQDFFKIIASQTKYLIGPAYDMEGYIIWERNS